MNKRIVNDNNNLNFIYPFNIIIKVLVLLYILEIYKIFFKKYFGVTDFDICNLSCLKYDYNNYNKLFVIIVEEIIVE